MGHNLLNKPVHYLADKLKGLLVAYLGEQQGLEALLELQDIKSVKFPLTRQLELVYSVLSQLDKGCLAQQAFHLQVSQVANYLEVLNNNSKAPSLGEMELQAIQNLSSVLNHLEHHKLKQVNHSLEIKFKDKAVSLGELGQPKPVFSAVRVL